ncbi:MAG TPA: DMT family transporter [Gaiellaceae bacterium]|nr:DMT family transporter [Gaiellaceae bacterium]
MTTRATGIAIAVVTAVVSGISVYVNSKGVSHFDDATVYTTAKNAVAGLLVVALALPVLVTRATTGTQRRMRPGTRREWLGLVALACIGGSVPFVLFFEGLSRASATQAAFIHKTLVVWVAILALALLKERIGPLHIAAIALVVAGQAWLLTGGVGTVTFGEGEAMILAATLLWAVEVILAKVLLRSLDTRTLAAARMGLGTVVLVGWLAVSGRLGDLLGLGSDQWVWAIATGLLLTAYVASWYAALARAQAVDVTAALVFGAVVTAVIARVADGAALDPVGITLVTGGVILVAIAALRRYDDRLATT